MARTLFVVVLAVVFGGSPLSAHPLDNSYAELTVATNTAAVTFSFQTACLQPFSMGPAALTALADPLEENLRKIGDHLKKTIRVTADGVVGALEGESHRLDNEEGTFEFRFTYRWPGPIRQLGFHYGAFAEVDPMHVCFAVVRFDHQERQYVFQQANRDLTVRVGPAPRPESVWAQARQFTALGLHHIGTGYDHLAFLVGLLLITRTFLGLVKIVTAFTLAHSLTLAVATLGFVSVPAFVVEPAIALTIAAVGIENLFRVRRPMFYAPVEWRRPGGRRWIVAFTFGLIHGLGFANVLKEMHLSTQGLAVSLVCFNVGVELGQVAIVAVIFPCLYGLERLNPRAHGTLARAGSWGIIALAAWWFAQRIGLV